MLKILQARLQQFVNRELTEAQAVFRKGRGIRDQIANIHWIIEKASTSRNHILLLYWLCQSLWLCESLWMMIAAMKLKAAPWKKRKKVKVKSFSLSDSRWLRELSPTRLLHPWDFPGKNSGMSCHFLLQGIFLTQGLNQGLLHSRKTLYLGKKVMTNLDSILKSRDITLLTKVHIVKAMIFLVVLYGYESWTIKIAECWWTDAFDLLCWRRLLRVSWTAMRSKHVILK